MNVVLLRYGYMKRNPAKPRLFKSDGMWQVMCSGTKRENSFNANWQKAKTAVRLLNAGLKLV